VGTALTTALQAPVEERASTAAGGDFDSIVRLYQKRVYRVVYLLVRDADAADTQAAALGVAPLMRGRRDNGSGFTYYDTADRAGVVLEIRQSPPA